MANLEKRKNEAIELLDKLSDAPEMDSLVSLNDYQSFVSDLRELWLNANLATKPNIIQRLIHKVEVGVDSVVVHYNVDKRNLGPKIGAPQATIVEPSTISEEYEIVWRRPQIDLNELVYLKTVRNYSRKQLSEYFSRPANTITWYLGRLKKEGRL